MVGRTTRQQTRNATSVGQKRNEEESLATSTSHPNPSSNIINPYSTQHNCNNAVASANSSGESVDTESTRLSTNTPLSPARNATDFSSARELAWNHDEIIRIKNFACANVHESLRQNAETLCANIQDRHPSTNDSAHDFLSKLSHTKLLENVDFSHFSMRKYNPTVETGQNADLEEANNGATSPPRNPQANDNNIGNQEDDTPPTENNEGGESEALLDSLANNTARLKTELREERKIWERTRGNRKKEGAKWLKEKITEATQLQENIMSLVLTASRSLIGLSSELVTKERVVETFDIALARNKDMPLLPNSSPTTELVTNEAVRGSQEFIQLRAQVQQKLDEFNTFYSSACRINAKWVVDAISQKRRELVFEEGLRLACLLASRARYDVGRDKKYTYPLRQQAAAAMLWILEDVPEDLEKYLRGQHEDYSIEFNVTVVKANLGFTNTPSIHVVHHQHDHRVATIVHDQLATILGLITHGVEQHLDDMHYQRMQEVETKTLLQSLEITKATDATAAVLRRERRNKGKSLDEAVDQMAENKVNKHLRNAQKKLRKNSSAGGQSPSSIAETSGSNGGNANRRSARAVPTASSTTAKATSNPKSILQTSKKKKRQNNVSFASDADTSGPVPAQSKSSSNKKKQQKKQAGGKNNVDRDAPNSGGNAGKRKKRRPKN